jgi:hypothetical protein
VASLSCMVWLGAETEIKCSIKCYLHIQMSSVRHISYMCHICSLLFVIHTCHTCGHPTPVLHMYLYTYNTGVGHTSVLHMETHVICLKYHTCNAWVIIWNKGKLLLLVLS